MTMSSTIGSGDEVSRAREHLCDVLCAADPSDGLWRAVRSGWAAHYVPEVPALALEQDPVHRHKDVLGHTIIVTANVAPRLRIRLAALFHDIAKPATRRITDRGVTFHHHEAAGARITARRLAALGFDQALTLEVARLVELSGRFHGYRSGWSDAAVRRYARDAGPLLGDLNELVRCDCTTRRPEKVQGLQQQVDDLERRIRMLASADEARRRSPLLDGREIMSILDIGPGPKVGEALALLSEAHRTDPLIDRDGCVALLRRWWL